MLKIPNTTFDESQRKRIATYISCVIEGNADFTPYITSKSITESWCLDSSNNWLLTFDEDCFKIRYRYDDKDNEISNKLINWLSFSLGVYQI